MIGYQTHQRNQLISFFEAHPNETFTSPSTRSRKNCAISWGRMLHPEAPSIER